MLCMQKVWNFTCYFTIFFPENPDRENNKDLDFGCLCGFLLEICVKIMMFVQNTWKSRTVFYQKKSGNQTFFMGGGQTFSAIAHFHLLKVDFGKFTTQWPMGHSGDDAVHRNPQKNELAESAKKFGIGLFNSSLYN